MSLEGFTGSDARDTAAPPAHVEAANLLQQAASKGPEGAARLNAGDSPGIPTSHVHEGPDAGAQAPKEGAQPGQADAQNDDDDGIDHLLHPHIQQPSDGPGAAANSLPVKQLEEVPNPLEAANQEEGASPDQPDDLTDFQETAVQEGFTPPGQPDSPGDSQGGGDQPGEPPEVPESDRGRGREKPRYSLEEFLVRFRGAKDLNVSVDEEGEIILEGRVQEQRKDGRTTWVAHQLRIRPNPDGKERTQAGADGEVEFMRDAGLAPNSIWQGFKPLSRPDGVRMTEGEKRIPVKIASETSELLSILAGSYLTNESEWNVSEE